MKKVKKLKKSWVNDEVLHLIALRGEMELEFAKNAKKKNVKFVIIHLNFFFQIIKFKLGQFNQPFKVPPFAPFDFVQFGHYED